MRTKSRLWMGLALAIWACGDDAGSRDGDDRQEETREETQEDASTRRDATADATARDASRDREEERDAARDERDASRDEGDASAESDASTSGAPAGWKLVWSDEFEGEKGALPSSERWVMETGGHGFGNNELEFYTARKENASLDGEGKLVITARAESYMGRSYTSARLKTQGKFAATYGRFEARLKLPSGQGIWPAFWTLGANLSTTPWPECGEIDIMENIGKEPTTVHGTLHGPGYSGGDSIGKSYQLPDKAAFAADFHVYAIEWEEREIRWYVDGVLYQTRKPSDLGSRKWVFDHDFFILLNLAVGGQWPGNPDASTKFPQTLTADYVRVYARD